MSEPELSVEILYFAALREERGLDGETVRTGKRRLFELYEELESRHGFRFSRDDVRPVVNGELSTWAHVLECGDEISFLPPVSGG